VAAVEEDLAGAVERLLSDFEWFAESFLWVVDKQSRKIVPFRFKPVQRRLARWMLERYFAGVPIRVIILKARREGVSTLIQAFFYWLCSTRAHQSAMTLSHHDDTTRKLHEISERFYRHSPTWLKPMKRKSRRGQVMEFANPSPKDEVRMADPGLESVMETVTAKNAGAGAGAGLVHCSEVGLWPGNQIDDKAVLDTLLQVVPVAPYTIVALESTARGMGNEFCKRWKQAERSAAEGLDDFETFFIAWFEEPTNWISGVAWEDLGDLSEREERCRDRYGCAPEQIAWRRYAIRALCGGDEATFDQEYPESPEVAFLSSGRPYFDQAACAEALEDAKSVEPLARGNLSEVDGRVEWSDHRHGKVTVWELPHPDEDYLIVLDPSEGSGGDPQAATVLKRSTLEQVAAWHGHIDRDLLGDQMFMLGKVYSGCSKDGALIAVEMSGGWGHTPLAILRRRGYARLYREIVEGKKRRKRGVRYGWYTTETSRPLALDALGEAIRLGEFESNDPGFWDECLTFVYGDTGKPAAEPGAHDDRVMANAVAVRLWQTEPRRRKHYGEAAERRVVSQRTGY